MNGFVSGYGTVRADAQRLAEQAAEIEGLFAVVEAVAGDDEQRTVVEKSHPPAVMVGRVLVGLADQDLFETGKRRPVETGAPDREAVGAAGALGVGEIDLAIGGEVRVENDVEEPALVPHVGVRHPGDGRGGEPAVANDAQAALPLRDEQVSAGQKSQRPGKGQPLGNRFHLVFDSGDEPAEADAENEELQSEQEFHSGTFQAVTRANSQPAAPQARACARRPGGVRAPPMTVPPTKYRMMRIAVTMAAPPATANQNGRGPGTQRNRAAAMANAGTNATAAMSA